MKKILVVDDDVDILAMMEMILSMNSFVVATISRWEKIDESINSFDPDLILLDVALGGADGRDICRKLKQAIKTQHIPIILFSAHAEMGNNYKEYNAQGFIPKPFEMSHLLKTVRNYVN